MILDMLIQSCSNNEGDIDNMCLSAYEEACDYLAERGYLRSYNGRIYIIWKKEDSVKHNNEK